MNHRDSDFSEVLARVNARLLQTVNGSRTHVVVPLVASGTGANEAALGLVRTKLLVLVAGRYARRLADIAQRIQVPTRCLEFDGAKGIQPDCVERALKQDPDIKAIAFVHHETTTSVMAPLREIGRVAREAGAVTIVDAISSIGGHQFDVVLDHVDVCTVTANKCLEGLPGISFVIVRRDLIEESAGKARSYYFDLHALWSRIMSTRKPAFTAAVQLFFALDKALERLETEGLESRIARYRTLKQTLRGGLVAMGFELVDIPDAKQSNILQMIHMPEDLTYEQLYTALRKRGYTIYTDEENVRKKMFFVATMGAIEAPDVVAFLGALEEVVAEIRNYRGQ
jgi:2-aminoethylphosphonate-pyruvate transaminase